MAKDFYDVLGVPRTASEQDIKQAYRKRSLELHPDKHKGDKDAEKKFKEVNEAYETLSNPKKRQMYDQFGSAGMNGGAGGFNANGFDFSSFTGQGGFSDLFENFFGGGMGGRTQARDDRGSDREVEITIDFEEVVRGGRRDLHVRKLTRCEECKGSGTAPGSAMKTCPDCGGTGQITRTAQSFFGTIQQQFLCPKCRGSGKIPEKPCKKCDGEGRTAQTVSVMIDIPAGINEGQTLRIRGEGDAGSRGGASGDLYVNIRVRPDARFVRDGDDIRTTLTLSVLDAMLGAEKSVETVDGSMTLKIPEGTQPNQIFRLKGKGLPVLNSSRRGDQYVTVGIEIPKKLSRAERKLIEEWKNLQD